MSRHSASTLNRSLKTARAPSTASSSIHSFKLKHQEIDAIQKTTREVAQAVDRSKCRFSAIKVNHQSRFFGVNRSVNSLVPYEATKIRLVPTCNKERCNVNC